MTHLPATGTVQLFFDTYDVTDSRPPNPVFINGTEIGSLCRRDSSEQSAYWTQCKIDFDVSLLHVGSNTFAVESMIDPERDDYDDFMFRFVQLLLPVTGATDELFLGYNERFGQYDDNTGAYQATIGSGTPSNPLMVDSDGDLLEDPFELAEGFNPNLRDSDGNGIDDVDEDLDGDGLSTLQEIEHETDHRNPDSDGDRIGDGTEVSKDTDPNDASDPKAFDLVPDNVLDSLDVFAFSHLWFQEIEELSFEGICDPDENSLINPMDLLQLVEKVSN